MKEKGRDRKAGFCIPKGNQRIISKGSILSVWGFFFTPQEVLCMFADSAKIFIKSGKGGDGHVPSDASCMFPTAVLTEVTAAVEATSFSR